MTDQLDIFAKSSEKPYPFVKFRCKKRPVLRSGESGEEYWQNFYLPVNGCHNSEQALINCEKDGMPLIGCGNLTMNNHKHIAGYLKARLQTNQIMAQATTLDRKIDEVRQRTGKGS